jgi:hypothetical protein
MHLLIPFAAPLSDVGQQALTQLQLPHLESLLARWAHGTRDDGDEGSFSPPHERAHARALGLEVEDGLLPWAALAAHQAEEHAWGQLTPAHWMIGSDQVTMLDPALLALTDAESQALLETVRPLFESEGFTLAWHAPTQWLATHPSFDHLRTASLDRVIGRGVDRWLPPKGQPGPTRLLRRLQNEVQMLLHEHPINEAREAGGALVVNSFWLSGCGRAQPTRAIDLQTEGRLRTPALSDDWGAWIEAWHRVDAGPIARLLDQPGRLTLCGERSSLELVARAPSLLQRLRLAPRRTPAAAVLASL